MSYRYENGGLVEANGTRHVVGCHGTGGCRCDGYRDLNPQNFPASRYVMPLLSVVAHLPKSEPSITAALSSKNTDELHAAAKAAFDELLEYRNKYERDTKEFIVWDALVYRVMGAMQGLGMR